MKNIAVLGLSFKAGTSDARKSPGVKIANLDESGAIVYVYDPHAINEASEDLRNNIKVMKSTEAAMRDTDVIIIATDWPELLNMNLKIVADKMNGNIF